MIPLEILETLPLEVLLQQKERFGKRNIEIAKMNQYLVCENKNLVEQNEVLTKTAERLIKLSNGVSIPAPSNDFKQKLHLKLHNIFSPIKEKIK